VPLLEPEADELATGVTTAGHYLLFRGLAERLSAKGSLGIPARPAGSCRTCLAYRRDGGAW